MNSKLQVLAGFAGGVVFGIFFHYVLHRISLPSEPFIYFSF
jgi:hypothetical protein